MQLAAVRLGKDSTDAIQALLVAPSGLQEPPVQVEVVAMQVKAEVTAGWYAAIWFGSDNNDGTQTDWVQGLRAFGRVISRTGGAGNNQAIVTINVEYIFPESLTKMNFLRHAPSAYYWFGDMPIIGITKSAQQSIQVVRTEENNQNPAALLYAIARIYPEFRQSMVDMHPGLAQLFSYIPLGPESSGRPGVTTLPELGDEPDEAINEALASLEKGRPVILKGPPGTSKSFSARQIARILTENNPDRVRCIQFHSAWSYEDFVEGQRVTTRANEMVIEPVAKVFKDLCLKAINHPESWVLIIDEINRADVNRVFGEVLSNLEYRDSPAQLLYSGDYLVVPSNLHIIGTMNDWDRSTVDLDYAFMRRFDEIEMKPSVRGLRQVLGQADDETVAASIALFEEIARVYPPGVGHAFFSTVTELADLERLWRRTIRPTLLRREGVLPGPMLVETPQGISHLDTFVAQLVEGTETEAGENGGNGD